MLGHVGVRLGLGAGRHPLSGRRPRAPAARPRRRLLREPPEQRRSAGPVRRAAPADAHPVQGGDRTRSRCSRARFGIGGFIPIDRRNKEAAMRSIEAGAASIRSGNSFLIFPEGTRSRTDEMLPFKKGGFIMAHQGAGADRAGRDSGGRAAMRRGSRIIRPVDDQHPRRRADRDRRAAR